MKTDFLKQKTSPNETNFYLDIVLLIGFLIVMYPDVSGLSVHEWLSLAFCAVLGVHLLLHWKWVVSVTKRFVNKLFHTRLKYLLNLILLLIFLVVLVSGVMESQHVLRALGLRASRNPLWEWLHSIASDWLWVTVGLHLVLDWKWILHAVKRYAVSPLQRLHSNPG